MELRRGWEPSGFETSPAPEALLEMAGELGSMSKAVNFEIEVPKPCLLSLASCFAS